MRQMLLCGFIALLVTPANQFMWFTPQHTRYRLILTELVWVKSNNCRWYQSLPLNSGSPSRNCKQRHRRLLNKVNIPASWESVSNILCQRKSLILKTESSALHRVAEEWWLSTQLQSENNLVNQGWGYCRKEGPADVHLIRIYGTEE